MTHNSIAALCIDIQHRISPPQIDELRRVSGTADFGAIAFKALGLDATTDDTAPLLLRVPPQLLDLPWNRLHDGNQYVALQRPFVLVLTEGAPPPPIRRGPLRILLTTAVSSGAAFDDARFLQRFAASQNQHLPQRQQPAVIPIVEHEVSERNLFALIEKAQDNGTPFHVWHHVGAVRREATGVAFQLGGGHELKPAVLQLLLNLLCNQNSTALRLLVLHTPSIDTRLLGDLAAAMASAAVCLRMGPQSSEMIRDLYNYLLTGDLAEAMLRTRQECWRRSSHDDDWSELEAVTPTLPPIIIDTAAHAQWQRAAARTDERQRFLFLRANPADGVPNMLPLDQELRQIDEALQGRRTQFEMREQRSLQFSDLSRVLNEFHPHLLHFSGHGLAEGVLVLETLDGKPAYILPEQFAAIVGQFAEIKCVVLNACYSTYLAELLTRFGFVVIGMSDDFSDSAAVTFATGFYRALAGGDNVAQAFEKAKAEILASGAERDVAMPQISDYDAARKITFFR